MVNNIWHIIKSKHELYAFNKDRQRPINHLTNFMKAFNLAEIVIVIGIIGIVAELTIPDLMSKYRENVVVTRLQKFYSTMNQAIMQSELENGDIKYWTYGSWYNYDANRTFVDTYLRKYLNITKTEDYYEALPVNGTRMYFTDGSAATLAGSWLVYAPIAGKAKEYGKDLFVFIINQNYATDVSGCRSRVVPLACANTRTSLRTDHIEGCTEHPTSQRRYCAALIMRDNWQIASDYPLKF